MKTLIRFMLFVLLTLATVTGCDFVDVSTPEQEIDQAEIIKEELRDLQPSLSSHPALLPGSGITFNNPQGDTTGHGN